VKKRHPENLLVYQISAVKMDFGRLMERERCAEIGEGSVVVVVIKADDGNVWMESMVLDEDGLQDDDIRDPSENDG
jgi:hypothetical protein